MQRFKLPLQHEFAEQKIIKAIVSLVLSHMWGVFTEHFSEISRKTHKTFLPFRQHGELIFLQDLYFGSVIYFVWTAGKRSLSIPLVGAGAMDSRNHSGNGFLTQCCNDSGALLERWRIAVPVIVLFRTSGVYPETIWSKVHKQFWAHGPGIELFQKKNPLSFITQSQSVLFNTPVCSIAQSEVSLLHKMLGDQCISWPGRQASGFLDMYFVRPVSKNS